MPVSGLLLRLADGADPSLLVDQLVDDPAIEPGELVGNSLPVVVEYDRPADARRKHEWMESLPAIDRVEVIHVGFEE